MSTQIPASWSGKTFALINVRSNTALDLKGGESANGTAVQGYGYEHGNPNQQWTMEPVDHNRGLWRLISVKSRNVLEIQEGSNVRGTRAQTWERATDADYVDDQVWYITSEEPQPGATVFKLTDKRGGLVLDLNDGDSANGTYVQGWISHNDDAQKWRFFKLN